jgi:hypothetical protein
VNADPDDEALSWGDDRDPTYVDPGANASRPSKRTSSERERPGDAAGASGHRAAVPGASPSTTAHSSPVAGPVASPADETAHGTADETADADESAAAAASMSSPMLLAVGILAGAYLLYSAGWFTSAVRNIAVPVGALDVIMFQLREYLAVAAPALWFGATLLLTRGRKPVTRLLWLVLGAIVLIPVPFVLGE